MIEETDVRVAATLIAVTKVDTKVEVQIPILVIVGSRERLTIAAKRRKARTTLESSRPVVLHDRDPSHRCGDQILIAVVVQVDKQRAGRLVEPIDASLMRTVGRGSIRLLYVEAIG